VEASIHGNNPSNNKTGSKKKPHGRRRFLEAVTAGTGLSLLMGTAAPSLFGESRRNETPSAFMMFRDDIFALPVWDTHNHLATSEYLCARSFWDMAHYFWFAGELRAAGYPQLKEVMGMSEANRAEAFVKAYSLTRNTMWHHSFAQTLQDLWNVEITDTKSVLESNSRIAETGKSKDWARKVCQKISIEKLTLQESSDNGLQEISDLTFEMAGGFGFFRQLRDLRNEVDQRAALDKVVKMIEPGVAGEFAKGRHVHRASLPESAQPPELKATGNPPSAIRDYLGHALFEALNKHRAHIQIFVGVERGPQTGGPDGAPRGQERGSDYEARLAESQNRSYAQNDPHYVAKMHGMFENYPDCTFEIISAAQLSNLDIVQAAGIYPNVIPGGMWWFNFRTSVYNEMMQYRLEALPATRCTLVATDARSIEWAYCKTLTTKNLLAKFLWKHIEEGDLDRDLALFVAREWLYGTAARLYR
jgi:hypothetical protein